MKILHLAPHPFFQERGTPIDDLLVLRVLTQRQDTEVDLLTYNEGEDVELNNLTIYRTHNSKFLKDVRPGFSIKKLFCDFFMFFSAWNLVRKNKYNIIHAGEEAVFFAMFFKFLYGIPYAYDLDSSIAQQLVEKKKYLKFASGLFNWFEKKAIQKSLINFPVCNALTELCKKSGSHKTVTLHDISQLKNPEAKKLGILKDETGSDKLFLVYIGNLESYQGIDLLIESFAEVVKKNNTIDLVIIGGVKEDIDFYKNKSAKLNISERVFFLGPKPFNELDQYLAEADILTAPRTKGVNTPMKVFPYLHSGKPVLLTDLYTHNQIIKNGEAYLAPANSKGFANGIIELAENEKLRKSLGERGKEFVERNHTFKAHKKRLSEAYNWIEQNINNKKELNTEMEYKTN